MGMPAEMPAKFTIRLVGIAFWEADICALFQSPDFHELALGSFDSSRNSSL
jgi:hypothetical protein